MQFYSLMFQNVLSIAAVAHGNIAVIAANQYLRAFRYNVPVAVYAGIGSCFCAAVTNRLDFFNVIGDLEKPHASREHSLSGVRTSLYAGGVVLRYGDRRDLCADDALVRLL